MFESLISSILNKVLGNFIEDIDSSQLNISVTSGLVTLKNMKLKPTLFDAMPLPFKVAYGQVGLIHLDIPIFNLMSKPLVI